MANKTTRAIEHEDYKDIISAILEGFKYDGEDGKQHTFRPNRGLALALQCEATMGMRISDILNLTLDSIVQDGQRLRLNVTEKKTKKERVFTVPQPLYQALLEYALEKGIKSNQKLFKVTERAIQKQLALVGEHLGIENLGSHSFRKTFAATVYENSGYNVELVRELLQHSSIKTTQRYIKSSSKQVESALANVVATLLIA